MEAEDCRWYESPDGSLTVMVAKECLRKMASICELAGPKETGGVLIGHYSRDHQKAIVLEATGPPADSAAGTTWFQRGVQGFRRLLADLWNKKRHYYLGEWHFHPYSAPTASEVDKTQMQKIASDSQYKCPEPILIIVGGDPGGDWAAAVHVFNDKQTGSRLIERK